MSEKERSELNIEQQCLSLQIDKSTETKTKICYYLDLPTSEREKHQLSKSERLLLRKKRYNLNTESERCVLNKTKICKKNCRDFEGQEEKKINCKDRCVLDKTKICKKECREFEDQEENKVNCRNRCKIDEKKPCIRFEERNDFSPTLSAKIKKRPWENHQKCTAQTFQCYCSELNKLIDEEKDTVKSNRTGLSDGKPLPYQDGIKIKLKDKGELNGQFLKTFKLANGSLNGQFLKTFQIQYKIPLSLTARNILTSFTNKYIYYAIDDILYLLNSNPTEKDNLLAILYSSILSLHNDFSINFFDIWIDSVYINDNFKKNRFLKDKSDYISQISETTITLKLHYFTRTPIKKPEPIW
ncbi:hypothetical protein MHU86_5620 (chloroplast) [Fragilaria crotonensis]|jgi:hypothetical protein|nr:hypothetical protein MHU86_5620 [Fragilaria crotonensis]WGN98681.1 hypothetical protein [Fragilaria capucina var. mesolepta]